jgi:DNA-binding MarR family transcriptional regulator
VSSTSTTPKTAAPAAAGVTPLQVGEAYLGLIHRLRRVADEKLSNCGLSMPRIKLLQYLAHEGATRQNVIATCFDLAPRSVTDMVDSLERDGLAVRRDDPTDRRAKLVELTPAGHESAASSGALRDQIFERIFGALDAPERATLLDLITILDRATVAATVDGLAPCGPSELPSSRSTS